MTRLFHVYFPSRTLVLLFVELIMILGAFVVATYVHWGPDMELQLTYEHGLWKILIAAVVCMLCMHYYDLYGTFVLGGPAQVIARIVQVLGTSCVLLSLVYYVYPPVRISFGLAFVWVTLTAILLALSRGLFVALNRSPKMRQKAVLVGSGPLARSLYDEVTARPEFGLALSGYVSSRDGQAGMTTNIPCLGSGVRLTPALAREGITHVVLAAPEGPDMIRPDERLELKNLGVVLQDGAALYEAISGKVYLQSLDENCSFRVSRGMLVYKRIGSILFASLALVITLPIILLAMIAIRLESSGAAIFRQKRVGKNGKLFTLYKLRTMYEGADRGEQFRPAQARDERCTKVGKWLRKARIDELPQLFNILRGDMYVIGPRPFTQNTEEECAAKIPHYVQRWAVKPGATGWAQVRRGYCASLEDNMEKLGYDLFYIKNMSLGLDLAILFETVKILILGRGSR